MKKYNSKYLFVAKRDLSKSASINRWVSGEHTNPPENSLIVLAINEQNLEDFSLVYSDDDAVLYQIIES